MITAISLANPVFLSGTQKQILKTNSNVSTNKNSDCFKIPSDFYQISFKSSQYSTLNLKTNYSDSVACDVKALNNGAISFMGKKVHIVDGGGITQQIWNILHTLLVTK